MKIYLCVRSGVTLSSECLSIVGFSIDIFYTACYTLPVLKPSDFGVLNHCCFLCYFSFKCWAEVTDRMFGPPFLNRHFFFGKQILSNLTHNTDVILCDYIYCF